MTDPKRLQGNAVNTGAAIVNNTRTSAIDICSEFTTLPIASVGVCLHRGVKIRAGGIGIEQN